MKTAFTFYFSFFAILIAASQVTNDWGITVNGTNSEDSFVTVSDAEGNVFMAGVTKSNDVDFDPGPGENLLSDDSQNGGPFLAKYDASGAHLWAFILPVDDQGTILDMVVDAQGGIYVLGVFDGTINTNPSGTVLLSSGSSSDAFVAHYFADGSFDFSFSIHGEGQTEASRIALDNAGEIIIGGTQTNVSDFDPSGETVNLVGDPSGLFLAKYSPIGEYVWAWVRPNDGLSFIHDIEVDEDDNILVAGSYSVSIDLDPFGAIGVLLAEDGQDGFIARYNSMGMLNWSRGFHGQLNEVAQGIEILANDDILVVGYFNGDLDADPGIGESNFPSTNSYNAFFVSMTEEGNYSDAFTLEASGDCRARCAHTDENNDIIVGGIFNGSFSPSDIQSHINYGGSDLYFVKYDQSLSYLNSFVVGGYEDDFNALTSMAVSGSKVIITGSYDVNFDFEPENVDDPATEPAGLTDVFLAQYTFGNLVGINESGSMEKEFHVFPNPTADFISWKGEYFTGPYRIVDVSGKLVSSGNSDGLTQLSVAALPPGMYSLQFVNQQRQAFFVKQ